MSDPAEMLALPAAHSMDTDWFAIDELGHVAMFDSGPVGPVPEAAARHCPTGSSFGDELLPLLDDVEAGVLSYDAADIFAAPPPSGWIARLLGSSLLDAPPRFDQSLFGVLLQMRPVAGVHERLPDYGLRHLPSREGDYAWGHLESPVLRELWSEGWIIRAALGHEIDPTRLGLFYFEHHGEPEPDVYMRLSEPRAPLRVHALPTWLRRRLAAVRFVGVDFRARETLGTSGADSTG